MPNGLSEAVNWRTDNEMATHMIKRQTLIYKTLQKTEDCTTNRQFLYQYH